MDRRLTLYILIGMVLGVVVGQVLLAPLDFVERRQYLQARGTLLRLLELERQRQLDRLGADLGAPSRQLAEGATSAARTRTRGWPCHDSAAADDDGDGAGGEGFDATGDTLFTSPLAIEKYLAAAEAVVMAVMWVGCRCGVPAVPVAPVVRAGPRRRPVWPVASVVTAVTVVPAVPVASVLSRSKLRSNSELA